MKTYLKIITGLYLSGVFLEDSFFTTEWAYETKTLMCALAGFLFITGELLRKFSKK